jgi:hypothetical protein
MRPLLLALTLCVGAPTLAQTAPSAAVLPAQSREVVAEGRAAIPTAADSPQAAVLRAKKAAQAQALRSAVEKALGIYVSARTLTSNYQLVRDEVTTRAEGFATLKEVISEKVTPTEVRVTLRALVSLRPLAKRLKALGLTRQWRVCCIAVPGSEPEDTRSALAALEDELARAGFVVVADPKEADLTVTLAPTLRRVHTQALRTAAGSMTMHSIRGDLTIRVLRAGETVAALSATETQAHIDPQSAASESIVAAAQRIAPRLIEALLVLPAALSQPLLLEVSGVESATQLGRLEDALQRLDGVSGVMRREYSGGRARWELEVHTDTVPHLAAQLERLSPIGLRIVSESRTRIVARR